MNTFEKRLLDAIMEEQSRRSAAPATAVGARPARRGRHRSLTRLSVVLAGAAALTVAFTLFGQGAPSAYAVTRNADGSVKVRILEFRDAGELEAELAGVGITAEIDYLPADQTCQQARGEPVTTDGRMKVGMARDGNGIEFEIGKGQIGTGQTLVLAISVDPVGPARPPVATSMQIVKGPVVPCEATTLPLPTGRPTGDDGDGHQPGPTDDRRQGDPPQQQN